MKKAGTMKESFDERVLAKHADKFDICHGDFNEKSVPNTDMGVFKVDWTDYMTP